MPLSKCQAAEKENKEKAQLHSLRALEQQLYTQGYSCIAGVDEAGRGPLAGPVVAAACCINPGVEILGINDSKQLSPAKRLKLYHALIQHPSVSYGIGVVSVELIDTLNIYQATRLAMKKAVEALPKLPDYLLIDGMNLEELGIPSQGLIKGDSSCYCIGAASNIAKEYRDLLMEELDTQWPHYGFAKHKGYGTAAHLKALVEHGPSPVHRKTFEPIKSFLSVKG